MDLSERYLLKDLQHRTKNTERKATVISTLHDRTKERKKNTKLSTVEKI